MNVSRRDFLKYTGATTLTLLTTPQATPSKRTLDKFEKREYKAYVFGCPDKNRPIYIPGNPVKVNANSLDEALKLIEQEARGEFPESRFPLVHIDRVYHGEEIVYITAWDEFGPSAAIKLAVA